LLLWPTQKTKEHIQGWWGRHQLLDDLDLNFEVNALVYSTEITRQLVRAFEEGLSHSQEIDAQEWLNRPGHVHLWEKLVRLLSPFL